MKTKGMRKERGAGLIILILVLAFLLGVGTLLLFVTGTGSQVAGNVRLQERAFNAAEAGFDAVFRLMNDNIINGVISDFSGQYRTDFGGSVNVLDVPLLSYDVPNPLYFRRLTDEELWEDIETNPADTIFFNQTLPHDSSLSYTVFLINDEAPGVTVNDKDCLVVCIGKAGDNTYARIEILIEIQQST
jgi:hypothetical protein